MVETCICHTSNRRRISTNPRLMSRPHPKCLCFHFGSHNLRLVSRNAWSQLQREIFQQTTESKEGLGLTLPRWRKMKEFFFQTFIHSSSVRDQLQALLSQELLCLFTLRLRFSANAFGSKTSTPNNRCTMKNQRHVLSRLRQFDESIPYLCQSSASRNTGLDALPHASVATLPTAPWCCQ